MIFRDTSARPRSAEIAPPFLRAQCRVFAAIAVFLLLPFAAQAQLASQCRTWDGGAVAPYSLDTPVKILLDPSGNVVVAITGTMPTDHPDYVVVKYNPTTGATIWEKSWGLDGGDFASDMEIDAAGDIYVTGTAFNFTDKFGTIKLRGSDGQLLWQAYDSNGFNHHANGLFLAGIGGVFVTGSSDPDTDISNSNDDYFTVKSMALSKWPSLAGETGCDTPSNVTASRVSSRSAQITWSAATGAISYTVQYRQVGTNRWRSS